MFKKMQHALFIVMVCISLLFISAQSWAVSGVTICQDVNFGGIGVILGAGSYTMTQMNAAGVPNDWMSSLRVPGGYTVTAYRDDNFTGTAWTFTSDTSWVGTDCNDQMTSVRISYNGATFYQNADYTGTLIALPPGSYTLAQINAAGIPDNWMSSLKVPSGYTVEVYQNDNFTGTKWTFTADTNYVGSACNDQMTSVKVIAGSASNSIYSVAASSIPAPTGSGAMTFRVMNGTNGAYSDSQIYWGILGINPANGRWSYLDLNGNLVAITNALNDAAGHLTKNGINYANIYYTISQKQWVSIPQMDSGRMFLSVGSPCYIKTFDTGFAGPDINNPTDPNLNVYFDFVEFTINGSGYHGNTTRVDGFGFPIQHRLVNRAGNYDRTVGEFESETRSGLFTKYQNEVPSQFKDLGSVQSPYRIVAPCKGSFKAGGANANYFAGYSSYSTQDILLGTGPLAQNAATCAAINRHVYTLSNWNNVPDYYNAAPANYYAKFWHVHSISGLAYGFCYDDVNGQAAYLEVGDPKGLIIRVAW